MRVLNREGGLAASIGGGSGEWLSGNVVTTQN